MKNVVVFATERGRYALELGWVREIFQLAHVTPVPLAFGACSGVCNFHGSVLPIIDVQALLDSTDGRPARAGDSAVVVEVDRVQAGLLTRNIEAVTTLKSTRDDGYLHYGEERLPLLAPPQLFEQFGEG